MADAIAYAHRSANFSLVAMGANAERLDRAWRHVADYTRGMYLSFDSSQRPERIAEAFPPKTLARLRAIKADVDPDGVLDDNFSIIDPAVADATSPKADQTRKQTVLESDGGSEGAIRAPSAYSTEWTGCRCSSPPQVNIVLKRPQICGTAILRRWVAAVWGDGNPLLRLSDQRRGLSSGTR